MLRAHPLFSLLTVALSVSILSLYSIKQKQKSSRILKYFFAHSLNFTKTQNFWIQLFVILSIHKPSLGSCEVPHKVLHTYFVDFSEYFLDVFKSIRCFLTVLVLTPKVRKFGLFLKEVP